MLSLVLFLVLRCLSLSRYFVQLLQFSIMCLLVARGSRAVSTSCPPFAIRRVIQRFMLALLDPQGELPHSSRLPRLERFFVMALRFSLSLFTVLVAASFSFFSFSLVLRLNFTLILVPFRFRVAARRLCSRPGACVISHAHFQACLV